MLKHKLLKHKQPTIRWKWVFRGTLVLILMVIGHQEAYIKDVFSLYLSSLPYPFFIDGTGSDLIPTTAETASRIVSLGYRLLYCSVCLLIIHAYFWKTKITKLALFLYLLLFALTLGLYVAAEQSQLSQLHIVAFRLDTLLVSPMPVVVLIPALYLSDSFK